VGVFGKLWAAMTRFSDMLEGLSETGEEINAGVRQRAGMEPLPGRPAVGQLTGPAETPAKKTKARA
jgi:hypothetical protein